MTQTEEWADKLAIDEIQRRFALSVDGKNFVELARIFTADGIIRFNGDIAVNDFIGIFSETQKVVDTQHFAINSVSVINGDTAVSSSYFLAYHRVPAKHPDETIGNIYGRYDVETDLYQGGTYDDELVRTADGWRLKVRSVGILWSQTAASHDRMQKGWTAPLIFGRR